MDITRQVIEAVEFHQRMRGYDPDEVDEFLERVAVAVAEMNEQLGHARQKVHAAERRVAEAEQRLQGAPLPASGGATAPVHVEASAAAEAELETLRRTLVLAQRTADAAVRDAEDQAARTVAGAHQQAEEILRAANAEAARVVAASEGDARRAHEETRQRLIRDIVGLEQARDAMRGDIGAIERHLDEQRLRLRGSVAEIQRVLDDPNRLRPVAAPEPTPIVLPDDISDFLAAADATDDEPAPEFSSASPDEPAAQAAARSVGPRFASSGPFAAHLAEPGESQAASAPPADDPWADFGAGDDDGGPPTRPVLRLDDLSAAAAASGDDAYLNELRKAMMDDTSAPDARDIGFFDDDSDDARQGRGRFGRRR